MPRRPPVSTATLPGLRITEGQFLAALYKQLGKRFDIRLWRQLVGNFFARYGENDYRPVDTGPPEGAADLSGYIIPEGWRLEIEAKKHDGTRSPPQVQFAHTVTAGGVVYLLAQVDPALTLDENVAKVDQALTYALLEKRKALRSAILSELTAELVDG